MNKSCIFLVVCLAIQTIAMSATTAEFVPQGATTVSPGTSVTFSINLIPALERYNSAVVVIGTNASGINFEYSAEWINHFSGTHDYMVDTDFYTGDQHGIIAWSSLNVGDDPITLPITLGKVTLYTDGLSDTSCWVKIDPASDYDNSILGFSGTFDPVYGYADIIITPEPGTLMFLGLSFLYGLKSRR